VPHRTSITQVLERTISSGHPAEKASGKRRKWTRSGLLGQSDGMAALSEGTHRKHSEVPINSCVVFRPLDGFNSDAGTVHTYNTCTRKPWG
jgi:hypothetical protein